jgi:peptidoglycan hydrolase-like amidase
MIAAEPQIAVGVCDRYPEVRGRFLSPFRATAGEVLEGEFSARSDGGVVELVAGGSVVRSPVLECAPVAGGSFVLRDVVFGIQFHWERKEDQVFAGTLRLVPRPGGAITAVNVLPVERYLESVIASEMSAEAPPEFLKAHAITSRSWLVAMLERERRNVGVPARRGFEREGEVVRWYDREDHDLFDVCADDHCQRYQGLTRLLSPQARQAVADTRGLFLVHGGSVCDARFSKACGGRTEEFRSAWEDMDVPYLQSVADGPVDHPPVLAEDRAAEWIAASPVCHCNTSDAEVLRQVLPSFDRETADFFRWELRYGPEELGSIVRDRSGIDLGRIVKLEPLARGPSGRIIRLRIEGDRGSVVVGKELEIRRWLSRSHLYSSAFVVEAEEGPGGETTALTLRGAGWGHGVGLCQIGAAVMASRGTRAEEIVLHYFRGAKLRTLYS